MEKSYDICSGTDARGRRYSAVVPAGLVRTGMYVRLVGGVFLLVDQVVSGGSAPREGCRAAEVLHSVWRLRGHG